MTERKASMGDKVYRGDVVKFIRNNISLGTFMKRTVKAADEACWDLCDKLNYVHAIVESNEPHWIPVTKPPTDRRICYVTLKDTKDENRQNWVAEMIYTPWDGFDLMDGIDAIAWMPKKYPEPYKGVTNGRD